jgi:hypothetical protein
VGPGVMGDSAGWLGGLGDPGVADGSLDVEPVEPVEPVDPLELPESVGAADEVESGALLDSVPEAALLAGGVAVAAAAVVVRLATGVVLREVDGPGLAATGAPDAPGAPGAPDAPDAPDAPAGPDALAVLVTGPVVSAVESGPPETPAVTP